MSLKNWVMKSNYKQLGLYIKQVDVRNVDNSVLYLRGVSSVYKCLIQSKANIIGTDMSTYKIVSKNQFVFNPNTARMGDKIPVALNNGHDCIVSQIYPVFEIIDHNVLSPEYLMMWFKRPEFDRYARFYSHGSAREIFDWEQMCNVELPIPCINKQKEIVKEYNVLVNKINLNNQLIQKLEEAAQAIYKQWFVDFEFPDENGKSYKSSCGEMEFNEELEKDIPKGWKCKKITSLCSVVYGNQLPKSKIELSKSGIYDVYGAGKIIGKYVSYNREHSAIIVGCRGSVGSMSLTNPYSFITNNSLIFNFEEDEKFFYYYQLAFRGLEDTISGSAQPQITIEGFLGVYLLVPGAKMIRDFNKFAGLINNNIFNSKLEIEKLSKLSDILLSKMATIKD